MLLPLLLLCVFKTLPNYISFLPLGKLIVYTYVSREAYIVFAINKMKNENGKITSKVIINFVTFPLNVNNIGIPGQSIL